MIYVQLSVTFWRRVLGLLPLFGRSVIEHWRMFHRSVQEVGALRRAGER